MTVSLICLAATAQASATVFNWNNTAGGDYTTAGNWTPGGGPPNDASDTAIFNQFAGYTVSLTNTTMPATLTGNLEVTSGTVTFDMYDVAGSDVRAYDYELLSTTAAAHIGGPSGSLFAAKLVLDGTFGNDPPFQGRSIVTTAGFLQIGRDANSRGILELNGADWTSTNTTFVGLNGIGTMTVKANSNMTDVTGLVGFGNGSSGTVTVQSDGRWDNSGDLSIGVFGSGSVTVDPLGILANVGDAVLGANSGSSGSLTVNGSWFAGEDVFVGGGAVSSGGSASLTITGFADVTGDMKIYSTASFANNNGILFVDGNLQWLKATSLTVNADDQILAGTLTIGAGGSLNYAGNISIFGPNLELGQLIAPAGSMTWTTGELKITNGDFAIDDTAPIGGVLTLNQARPLTVSGALRVGTAGTVGSLFIIDGLNVVSGSGQIGNTNPASNTIPVAVDQPGSTWTMTGDLTMGNVAGAGAQLTVTNEATVSNVNAFVSPNPGLHSELLFQSTTGVSMWNNTGSAYIGGNAATGGGTANVIINTGGVVNVGTLLRIWDQATVTVDNGSLTTPSMHLSGTFNHTGPLDLTGTGPIGSLILDGGAVNADVIDFGANGLTGHGSLNGEVIIGDDVVATGDLTLGDASSFNGVLIAGGLDVGAHTVTINKKGFFTIGPSTVIAGGTLNVANGVVLPAGESLTARGTINGRVVQQAGSVIVATNDLTLGDAASPAGFFSDGEMIVDNKQRIFLMDANEAVLGSLTTLGGAGLSGALAADNGAVLELGKNIVGYGSVETPDDPSVSLTNNGNIAGNSPAEPITLTGYVKGLGKLDNVVITGTDAPGLSIATVQRGSVVYEGTLQIEIGGPAAGGFDMIQHTGSAMLGGTLELITLNGYNPGLGDSFQIISAASSVGQFDSLLAADLGNGLKFDVIYTTNSVTVQVVNALFGDLDGDGFVGIADLNIVLGNWNQNVATGDPLVGDPSGDGFVGIEDLNIVLGNWNTGTPPSADTVPEPAALIVWLSMAALGFARRRG